MHSLLSYLALIMAAGLGGEAFFVAPTLAELARDERVAHVVAGARAYRPIVAVPVVPWRTLSVRAAWVGVAVILCEGRGAA